MLHLVTKSRVRKDQVEAALKEESKGEITLSGSMTRQVKSFGSVCPLFLPSLFAFSAVPLEGVASVDVTILDRAICQPDAYGRDDLAFNSLR